MSDLTEFLLARIADDEQLANAATLITSGVEGALFSSPYDELTDHMVQWEPARVLAECEAKRRIVEDLEFQETVAFAEALPGQAAQHARYVDGLRFACQALALPYADHPDYQAEWAP